MISDETVCWDVLPPAGQHDAPQRAGLFRGSIIFFFSGIPCVIPQICRHAADLPIYMAQKADDGHEIRSYLIEYDSSFGNNTIQLSDIYFINVISYS